MDTLHPAPAPQIGTEGESIHWAENLIGGAESLFSGAGSVLHSCLVDFCAAQIAEMLRAQNIDPVWKDFDQALVQA